MRVYRYHILILAAFKNSRILDGTVLLGNEIDADTHSKMSGSQAGPVSSTLFSYPGFDRVGNYINKLKVEAKILNCYW